MPTTSRAAGLAETNSMSSVGLPKTDRVSLSRIIGKEERNKLKGGQFRISDISGSSGDWMIKVTESSWKGRVIGFLKYDYVKGYAKRAVNKLSSFLHTTNTIDYKLLAAYIDGFHTLTVQPPSSVRTVFSLKEAGVSGEGDELATPLGFRIASALDFAGACSLRKDKSGKVGLTKKRGDLDDETISHIDYLVNLSPVRLTYEFIADDRKFPNGYLDRVLIPFYVDRLVTEAGMTEADAIQYMKALQNTHGMLEEDNIDLEPMMEIRNAIDKLAEAHTRKVSTACGGGGGHFPDGGSVLERDRLPRKVRKITVGRILDQGRAARGEVRDFLIRELRKKGETQEKAREMVVAALNSRGVEVGKTLSIDTFQELVGVLGLYDEERQGDIVRNYLNLVTLIDKTQKTTPGSRNLLLQQAGMKENEKFAVSEHNELLTVINPPALEAPSPDTTYTCDYDELWAIQAKVDRGWKLRWTKDMYKRIVRWIARNKRVVAVQATSKVVTAIVTGLMSGGIAGATYLGCAVLCLPVIIGAKFGLNKVQELWHRRKLWKYDEAGEPDHASKRDSFHSSIAHVVSEESLVDCYNSYFNLKEDLQGLKKLKAKANKSAREQIEYRRYQVMQQLRTAELGESYKDMGKMMVEVVTDISTFEQEFEKQFLTLWRPFSKTEKNRARKAGEPYMTDAEKAEIFNEAANRLLLKGTARVAQKNQTAWIKELVHSGAKDGRKSGKLLLRDLGRLKAPSKTDTHASAAVGRVNWLTSHAGEAAKHTAKAVGHFVYTSIIMNASKILKAGALWIMTGILPRQVDVLPVPTAAVGTYWISSFIGGQTLNLINNCRNRLRVKKIIKSRRKPLSPEEAERQAADDAREKSKTKRIKEKVTKVLGIHKERLGEQVTFDAKVDELGPEDFRALRSEGCEHLKQIPRVLKKLRAAHDSLNKDVEALTDPQAMFVDKKEQLIKTATLILERKYLEQQMQELMSGSVGTFYEETIRGEWLRRQEVDDLGHGVPVAAATT
ncbi:hypothetical protein [Parendozoicomonas sp. Alg238-R29]|uniref:hypothetical protein n=1 Tax=Parendozoicomonas sp. Alg238-R29 TaxID=2993446 RepID=UPI00248D5CA1|nr:hypothetical protein [Parendozoicomonas sp. Alg238-R29]